MFETQKELVKHAAAIKEFCSDRGVYHEEECPFFRGYKISESDSRERTVICALNMGKTSPCNWKIN